MFEDADVDAFEPSDSKIGKWMAKHFGSPSAMDPGAELTAPGPLQRKNAVESFSDVERLADGAQDDRRQTLAKSAEEA